ncbi:MAG: hypothetical protein E7265_05085, partial [Lachnospiraceae bacterium]|nr:hypothetical protein [Lachnospiraceae bacterium]
GSTDNPEATPDGSSGSTDNPETTPTQKPVVTNAPTQKPVVTNAPTQKPAVTNAPTQKPAVTNAPTQKPAVTNAPTAKPAGTSAPTYVSRELDLSGASTVYNAGKVTVNSDKTITAITEGNNKLQGVLIPLGDTLYAGETAKVTVYGTSTGSVRLWLSDGEAKRWSDIQDPMSFETTYSFTANNFEGSAQAGSNTIQIKATYGSTVDSIHITKVVIAVEADAPVSTPTGKPVATNAPTVKPSGTSAPTYVSRELDLSGASTVYNAGKVTVNSDKTITAITEGNNKLQGVLIPLGDTLYAGETAKVTVYGTSTGSVRLWLSDGQAKRWSDIQDPMSFETKYSFTANNFESSAQAGSNAIQIKATYGSTLDSIHITKVVIETMAKAPTPSPAPPKPTCTPIPGEENYKWVTTWGTAEEKNDITPEAMAPMTLNGSTIRQIIRVTTSGNTMKFRLSNQYGGSDVTIKSMHVAKQVKADESTIDTSTDTVVTVNGSEEFVIPRGKVIETDPVNISVNALDNIAISTYYGSCPSTSVTGHRGARATTYQMTGNNVSTETFTNYKTTTSWFFLADAAIWSPQNARAVVCFGDSITDGYGTDAGYLGKKPDSYTRWGDYFARRLQANDATKNVSVINEGIGSNSILGSYPTDAGKDRFARDLLEHDGVEYCIILFGVNDLDKLPDTSKFDRLKPEYEKMIALCKANNIKVYAAPILPFKGSSYFSEGSEATRQLINNWFKSSESGVDGIIDFASALVDPSNPLYILEKYTHSDGLHPYDGYEAMANAIDLTMFEK